jgi:hypothetical protein
MAVSKFSRKKHAHHIDKRLRFRLQIYLLVSVIMVAIVGYDMVVQKISYIVLAIALLVGFGIGILAARMFKLSWDKDMQKVISRLDFLGVIILVVYIASAILRRQVISYFVPSNSVTAVSFAVIAGVMLGRVFGTGRKIVQIIEEEVL